jgi:hypothetical protein
MRKLLAMSLIILPLVIPIWTSRDPNVRRGLRRTVWAVFALLVSWTLIGSHIYLASSPSE